MIGQYLQFRFFSFLPSLVIVNAISIVAKNSTITPLCHDRGQGQDGAGAKQRIHLMTESSFIIATQLVICENLEVFGATNLQMMSLKAGFGLKFNTHVGWSKLHRHCAINW